MLTSSCEWILRGGFSPPPRPEAVNTMDALDFSEEEIQEQLAILGYRNIPKHRLHEFKQDLDELIRRGEWKTLTSPTQTDAPEPHPAPTQPSPPPYTKEKVSQCYFQGSDEGFFLHSTKTDHESQVHNTSQNRRCEQQQGNRDSYARYSVAPKLQLPSGAPSRRQVEQDPEDLLHPSFTDSYTSPPDSQGRRLIKRKVLRKHEGQSLVCDESFFSEDSAHSAHLSRVQVSNMYKMYNAQWDEGSEDDKDCLSSSFWTDEEKQEEEEEEIERVVSEEDSKAEAKRAEATSEKENGSSDKEGEEIKRVVEEEESKPVDEAEGSSQEASEEEKPDMKNQENFTGESSEDGSDEEVEEEEDNEESGSDDDEEEQTERDVNEDESKLVPEAEDSFKEASEEEKPEVKNQENFTGESSEDGSDEEEEEREAEDDEEEEIERVVTKEESKLVEISGDGSEEEEEEEEEEGEEIERVVNKDEAVESSQEEKPDMKNQENYSEESSEDGSDEEMEEEEEEGADDEEDGSDDDEEEEDEWEEMEQEFNEEESKLVAKLEDFLQEASEEERLEVKNQENFTRESCEDGSDEEEEEEEEIERVVNGDVSKPVAETEEEQPEVKNQENFTRENSKCGSDDDKEEEEGNCTSSCSSPAQSLMTSGYGTYRPEEQEGGDYRDDHTITEFDQDSRGDASEMRDDEEEDNRSLSSFGGFEIESTRERGNVRTRPESVLENEDQKEPGADGAAWSSHGGRREEEDVTDSGNKDVTNERTEGRQHVAGIKDGFISDEKHLENGKNPEEGTGSEKPDEEEWDVKVEREAEDEDPDESSSNKDIKFIDSKVDFSWMAYDDMEWEGNLRQKKASCLEEGLAELHVSSSTRQDFETENEDVPSHSSEEDRISLSAFESYISGMTESESEYDFRPKPKSFIRPVMNQQNLKKTDPVTKYFQYKQFWDAFKLPGEKDRRALRWEIRERLAHEPPPTKPRRVLVPNTYIVPTEKKRAALRWEIRNDLANGLLPHKLSH